MAIKTMEMIRKIRDEHYRILKDKSVDEQIAFYRRKSRSLRAKVSQLFKKQVASL